MNEKTKLSQFFPSIRAKELILDEITSNKSLSSTFNKWNDKQQQEFLNICSGNKGVKMLYDSYFKEILSPEYAPERLSDFLSVLLNQKVTVKAVLPNDNTRLGDEMSLVITDIVVEMEDKTIANIEVQKIGYAFTGQRAACYSADLLLRQYKRIRDERKKDFSYREIAPVFTIVLMEDSTIQFQEFKNTYVHSFTYTSDSGLKLTMPQSIIFVSIDIFLEKLHNKGIKTKLDAWLTFLGCDEPEYIIKLINKYPFFKPMYEDLYDMCLNTERVMNMYSKELAECDRNTVKYMIDELQEQIDTANEIIAEKDSALAEKESTIARLDSVIKTLEARIKQYESQDHYARYDQ